MILIFWSNYCHLWIFLVLVLIVRLFCISVISVYNSPLRSIKYLMTDPFMGIFFDFDITLSLLYLINNFIFSFNSLSTCIYILLMSTCSYSCFRYDFYNDVKALTVGYDVIKGLSSISKECCNFMELCSDLFYFIGVTLFLYF